MGVPFGRIEVFRRVAVATVSLESPTGEAPEVEMDCGIGEERKLRFRVAPVKGLPSSRIDDSAEKKKDKIKDRMDDAKRFLDDNRLEDLMAVAMREVIRARPDEPHKFLAEQILTLGETMKFLPKPALSQSTAWGQPSKPAPGAPFVFKPSVGSWIMQTPFSPDEGELPVPPAEPQYECFQHMPSVGAWFMDLPLKEEKPYKFRPSVGTWLAPAPIVDEEDIAFTATVVSAAPKAHEASGGKVPLCHMPSCGWLAPKPYQVEKPWYYQPGVDPKVTALQEEIAKRDKIINELQMQMQRLKQVVGQDTFASVGIALP